MNLEEFRKIGRENRQMTISKTIHRHPLDPDTGVIASFLRYISGPLVAFIVFFSTNNFSIHISEASIDPFIWAVISYVLAHHTEQFLTNRDIQRHIRQREDRLADIVHEVGNQISREINDTSGHLTSLMSHLNVSVVDETVRAERTAASINSARYIRNTYVNLASLTGTKTPIFEAVNSHYESFL